MRPCTEQPNDLAPLSPFRSWLGCITNTSGYDFRKGQGANSNEPKITAGQAEKDFEEFLNRIAANSTKSADPTQAQNNDPRAKPAERKEPEDDDPGGTPPQQG